LPLGHAAIKVNFIRPQLQNKLVYVPIRSVGNSENSFNPKFGQGDGVFFNIEAYMKNLIDTGIPFVLNSHEHTRVCIGYTEDEWVFADSWGNEIQRDELDPELRKVNRIKAGYSFAPMNMIVSYIRELVEDNKNRKKKKFTQFCESCTQKGGDQNRSSQI
jgi:hypothetical protein